MKPVRGQFVVAKVEPKRKLAEFRVAPENLIEVGAEITADHYVEGQFGLRIENLYVTKTTNKYLKLKNITLVPYDLDLINFKLITNDEKKYIKKYHKKIYETLQPRLNNEHKKYFLKNLIYKI